MTLQSYIVALGSVTNIYEKERDFIDERINFMRELSKNKEQK